MDEQDKDGTVLKRIVFLIVILCPGLPAAASAAAFDQPDFSAAAVGVANAYTALADDASAMAYNPAGIAWLDGVHALAGATIPFRDSSAEITGGIAPDTAVLGNTAHVFLTWMPRDRDFGFGIGVSTPYAMESNWGDSIFGGQASRTRLFTLRTSLDGIYAFSSTMAVAAGADWYYTQLDLKNAVASFSGTDTGSFGGHVAWLWRPMPSWSLGAMFRLGPKLGVKSKTDAGRADVQLPNEAHIGVGYSLTDGLRLELDGSWTGWSDLRDMSVAGGAGAQTNNLNLRDTFAAMAGITWTWRERSQFRFGYAFDQGANRDSGFNARIADGDSHRFSLGMGGDVFGVHADLAYAYTYFPKRKVSTGTFAGTFRDRRQVIAISIGKVF